MEISKKSLMNIREYIDEVNDEIEQLASIFSFKPTQINRAKLHYLAGYRDGLITLGDILCDRPQHLTPQLLRKSKELHKHIGLFVDKDWVDLAFNTPKEQDAQHETPN